jgi:hypothetical protein
MPTIRNLARLAQIVPETRDSKRDVDAADVKNLDNYVGGFFTFVAPVTKSDKNIGVSGYSGVVTIDGTKLTFLNGVLQSVG